MCDNYTKNEAHTIAYVENDIIIIENLDKNIESEIRSLLSYKDKSKEYQIKKMSKNPYAKASPFYKQLLKEYEGELCEIKDGKMYLSSGFYSIVEKYVDNIVDNRKDTGDVIALPWASSSYKLVLRDYQQEAVDVAMCHAKGQKILMYDGTIKLVEDIDVGDKVMGPDSKPRTVLNLTNGIDKLYKIIPVKGDPFIVNENHILSLRRSYSSESKLSGKYKHKNKNPIPDDEIFNISVLDYLNERKSFKHKYKLYRSDIISFSKKDLPIDPYIFGAWLGDGISRDSSFANIDQEIINSFEKYAEENQMTIRKYEDGITYRLGNDGKNNCFLSSLRDLNVLNSKHIPQIYMSSSIEQRLQLLAGLLDTDGCYYEGLFDITQKSKDIADSIAYVARSLGFACYIKESYKRATNSKNKVKNLYYRLTITGDIDKIPTRVPRKQAEPRKQIKNVLNVGFKVEELEPGEFYGFSVDGDHLYLMGDFTVTHNCNNRGIINLATGLGKTKTAISLIRSLKRNTLVVCPNKSIAKQFESELIEAFGKNKVGFIGSSKYKPSVLTVGIAASVCNRINDIKKLNLGVIIFDETHHTPANTFYTIAEGLGSVGRIYGLTATAFRSDGKDLFIQAACGDILIKRDVSWGVKNKWLSSPYFIVRKVPTTGKDYKDNKLKCYQEHVLNSEILNKRLLSDSSAFISNDKYVLILVSQVEHGKFISEKLGISFANGSDKNSSNYIDQFNNGKIKSLVATDGMVGEGVDTRNVEVLIMANFTASKSAVLQAVGRGLRKTPEKDKCIILDYIPEGSSMLTRHAKQRIKFYKEITNNVKLL